MDYGCRSDCPGCHWISANPGTTSPVLHPMPEGTPHTSLALPSSPWVLVDPVQPSSLHPFGHGELETEQVEGRSGAGATPGCPGREAAIFWNTAPPHHSSTPREVEEIGGWSPHPHLSPPDSALARWHWPGDLAPPGLSLPIGIIRAQASWTLRGSVSLRWLTGSRARSLMFSAATCHGWEWIFTISHGLALSSQHPYQRCHDNLSLDMKTRGTEICLGQR